MGVPRQYASANAFRTALEARLNERARREGVDLGRLRRQVSFDRLLARMFDASHAIHDGWILKGGYALEMRFLRARSTKDLDLTVRRREGAVESTASLRERLLVAASVELPDFFVFEIGEVMADLNQAPEGGARFPVDARLDGRTFVRFHVDLGVGDDVLEPLESVAGQDWLGFAGISVVVVPALSIEQHWAEKLHAYTRPREATNSRVRDLVDLVLILEEEQPSIDRVRQAVTVTFARRNSHSIPKEILPPPAAWATPFAELAAECGLDYTSTTAYERVLEFWRTVPTPRT
jgi:predicted nucleotidyltransferase component of viral defense system